jgi:hypothetical protein
MRYYRFRLRDRSTLAAPNGTTDLLVVSNRPGDAMPFLEGPPSGQGAELRVETGETMSGEYAGVLLDAKTGTLTRAVTAILETAQRQWAFGSNRAYWEYADDAGPWQVLVAGYCTRLEQLDALAWSVAVGDTRRIERQATITSLPTGTFPLRGCLAGGPILGTTAWGPIIGDRGGWTVRVDSYDAGTQTHVFRIEKVYANSLPEQNYANTAAERRAIDALRDQLNDACRPLYDDATQGFPTLRARIVSTGLDYAVLRPAAASNRKRESDLLGYATAAFFAYPTLTVRWTGTPLTVGATHRLHIFGTEITPTTPIYWDGHPVDLFTTLCAQEGIPVNAAAAASVRTQLGDQLRYVRRFTAPFTLYDELRDALYQPFGVAVHTAGGEYVPAVVRLRPDSVPSDTLVLDDLVDPDPALFKWTEDTVISDVVVAVTEYVSGSPTEAPFDGVVKAEVTYPVTNPNPTPFGKRTLDVRVRGYYYLAASGGASSVTMGRSIARAIGTEVYNRFGAGCPSSSELLVRRSSPRAATPLGAELYVQLPQQPNGNRRLADDASVGARVAQVVQRTEYDDAVGFRLLDSGSDAQPVAPAPVLTMRADPEQPRTHAQAQITNAAAINAADVLSVEIETVVQVASPTAPGVVLVRFPEGNCEAGWFSLGRQPAGVRVWARARTRQVGRRPSAFTAWQSVDLGVLSAPTTLLATPVAGTAQVQLTWTPTALGNRSAVYLFQGASPPGDWTASLVQVCAPGETQLVVETVAGSLPYQWAVRQLDADGTPGALATASFVSLGLGLATGAVGGAGTAGRLARWLSAVTIEEAPVVLDLSGLWPTSATLDLGTILNPWRDAYLSRDVFVGGALRVNAATVSPGPSVRYIGGGNTLNQWYTNVPTGGAHRWAVNEAVRVLVDDGGMAVTGALVIGTDPGGTNPLRVSATASGSRLFRFLGPSGPSLYGYTDSAGVGITNSDPYTGGALLYQYGTSTAIYSGTVAVAIITSSEVQFARQLSVSADVFLNRQAGINRTLWIDAATSQAARINFQRNGALQWYTGMGAWSGTNDYEIADVSAGIHFRVTPAGDGRIARDWFVDRDLYVSGNVDITGQSTLRGLTFANNTVQVQGGAGLLVVGATRTVAVWADGSTEAVALFTRNGWLGSGSTTEGALTFRDVGWVYARNSGTPTLQFGTASSVNQVVAHGDVRVLGNFRRPDDAGVVLVLGNGMNTHYGDQHDIRDAAGSGWGLLQIGRLIFSGTNPTPGAGTRYIGDANTGTAMFSNVPSSGGIHYWAFGDTWVMRLIASGGGDGLTLTVPNLRADSDWRLLTTGASAQRILTGGLLASDSYADASLIPTNGIYSKGVLDVDRIAARSTTVDSTFPGGLTGRGGRRIPEIEWGTTAPSVARPIGTLHAQLVA